MGSSVYGASCPTIRFRHSTASLHLANHDAFPSALTHISRDGPTGRIALTHGKPVQSAVVGSRGAQVSIAIYSRRACAPPPGRSALNLGIWRAALVGPCEMPSSLRQPSTLAVRAARQPTAWPVLEPPELALPACEIMQGVPRPHPAQAAP